jgi:hypothetical protein
MLKMTQKEKPLNVDDNDDNEKRNNYMRDIVRENNSRYILKKDNT